MFTGTLIFFSFRNDWQYVCDLCACYATTENNVELRYVVDHTFCIVCRLYIFKKLYNKMIYYLHTIQSCTGMYILTVCIFHKVWKWASLIFSFLMKEKKTNWYRNDTRHRPIRRCVYSESVMKKWYRCIPTTYRIACLRTVMQDSQYTNF